MFPGRSQEVPGDRHPREMIMARMRVQNSAYNPLQFILYSFSLSAYETADDYWITKQSND